MSCVILGDVVCVFLGCPTSVVLREADDGNFTVVGECYIHGMMEGEAIKWQNENAIPAETFEIR